MFIPSNQQNKKNIEEKKRMVNTCNLTDPHFLFYTAIGATTIAIRYPLLIVLGEL